MSPKHHHSYEEKELDTETLDKFRRRKWWAKWISIGGLGTIAALLVALPVVKDVFAYGHDAITAPSDIRQLRTETTSALKSVQGQIDTIQLHEYEGKIWQAKTDERLDNIEKLLNRVLDNQEKQNHGLSPKQRDNQP